MRQRIGVAPQALALYDLLTGEENLRFFGEVYGLSGATLGERVKWCLDFVGLSDRKGDRVGGYSGGMKRRLNLAAAVLHDPELILLDEPTVGVDPQSRNKIFESIEALHRDGRTIIYTTHYMEEVERLCERIAIVDAGKLLALGTLDELLAAHGGTPTLIVTTNGAEQRLQTADPLAELNRIAARSTIDQFQMERPTMEQVFLRLTGRSLEGLIHETDHRARVERSAPHAAQSRRHVLHLRVADPRHGAVRHHVRRQQRRPADQGADRDRRRRQQRRLARVPREARGVVRADADDAAPMPKTAVRRGQRTGFIVVKPGFGEASNRMFYGSPKEIEVGVDPARQAEAGMIEGLLMKHAAGGPAEDVQRPAGVDDDGRQGARRHAAGAARSGRAGAALSRRAEDVRGHAAIAGCRRDRHRANGSR